MIYICKNCVIQGEVKNPWSQYFTQKGQKFSHQAKQKTILSNNPLHNCVQPGILRISKNDIGVLRNYNSYFFGATLLKQCCFSSGTNWMVSVRQAFADMSFVASGGGPMSEDTLIWIVLVRHSLLYPKCNRSKTSLSVSAFRVDLPLWQYG